MSVHINNPRDLVLLNMVGLSLFRVIMKARDRSKNLASFFRSADLSARNNESAVGYEAAWTGSCSGGQGLFDDMVQYPAPEGSVEYMHGR